MDTPDRPVFVVGPPRSGTTLTAVALSRHPDLHVNTETHLFDVWVERYPALTTGDRLAFDEFWSAFSATDGFTYLEIDADHVVSLLVAWDRCDAAAVMSAILLATATATGARRVGEKTPDHARYLAEILAAFPDARIVFTLRDPRAAVASELRLDRDWASDDPEVAAERWRRCAEELLVWGDDPRVVIVRYGELVTAPRPTLERLCAHLDLEWHDALLADEGGHPTYRHGDQDPWGPISTGSLHTWRDELDTEARRSIERICGEVADRLGYPLEPRLARPATLLTRARPRARGRRAPPPQAYR